jgi:hypothetical protein
LPFLRADTYNSDMKIIGKKVVDELKYGVYVWQMPDGRWVGDDEGNFLSISAQAGDRKRIDQLKQAVRHYGVEEGAPLFLSGHRKISDEEYENQRLRMEFGLLPDEYDVAALSEEQEYHKKYD